MKVDNHGSAASGGEAGEMPLLYHYPLMRRHDASDAERFRSAACPTPATISALIGRPCNGVSPGSFKDPSMIKISCQFNGLIRRDLTPNDLLKMHVTNHEIEATRTKAVTLDDLNNAQHAADLMPLSMGIAR
jgi:hypothetical protein